MKRLNRNLQVNNQDLSLEPLWRQLLAETTTTEQGTYLKQLLMGNQGVYRVVSIEDKKALDLVSGPWFGIYNGGFSGRSRMPSHMSNRIH